MKITIIKTHYEYAMLQKIAEALGYSVKVEKDVGPPFWPIICFEKNNVEIISGADSNQLKIKKTEGYTQLQPLEFIHELIINITTKK